MEEAVRTHPQNWDVNVNHPAKGQAHQENKGAQSTMK